MKNIFSIASPPTCGKYELSWMVVDVSDSLALDDTAVDQHVEVPLKQRLGISEISFLLA